MADSTTDNTDGDILDPDTLKPRKRPIEDASEAHGLAKRYFDDRRKANINHGLVRLKYDGEPPYKIGEHAKSGMAWRRNFSVKSISTSVSRSTPAFISFIDALRYLTASRLPDGDAKAQIASPQQAGPAVDEPDASQPFATPPLTPTVQEKGEIFQRSITSLYRGWKGSRTLDYQNVDLENLFGHMAIGWTDDVEWRPQAFSYDEYAVNGESGHDVNECDAVVFKKDFAIHQMISFIEDREAAEAAGWNVDNVVEAINSAMPEDARSKQQDTLTRYADMIRNGTLYQGSRDGAKVVRAYIVNYKEYSGKVSQYIVSRDNEGTGEEKGKELFFKEDRFEKMSDAACLFSRQWGAGKHYSSIGLGRELFGPSLARDMNMCQWADATYINGLKSRPERSGGNNVNTAPARYQYPYVFETGVDAEALKIPSQKMDVPSYETMDARLGSLIEELSNAYLPKNSDGPGEKVTAAEIIEDAKRVNFQTGDLLARFYGQRCAMMESMQRRACSEDNIKAAKDFLEAESDGKTLLNGDEFAFLEKMHDKEEISEYAKHDIPEHLDREAVMMCVGLLREGLTPLDIYRLSRSPASEPMGDTPAATSQKLIQAYTMFNTNPGVDQVKFLREVFSAVTTPQLAEELLLPPNDPNDKAAAQERQQLLELAAMTALGVSPAVLPADDDVAHCNVLKQGFGAAPADPAQIAANPQVHNSLTLGVGHYQAHMAARKQKGEKGEQFAQDFDTGQHMSAVLNKANEIVAKQQPQQQVPQQPPP